MVESDGSSGEFKEGFEEVMMNKKPVRMIESDGSLEQF